MQPFLVYSDGLRAMSLFYCNFVASLNSTFFIKSYRNYLNIIDKNGKATNEPAHAWSDGMDAVRYGMQIKGSHEPIKEYVQPPYERAGFDSDSQGILSTLEEIPSDFIPHRR